MQVLTRSLNYLLTRFFISPNKILVIRIKTLGVVSCAD